MNLGAQRSSVSDIQIWGDKTIPDQNPLYVARQLDLTDGWENVQAQIDSTQGSDFKFHNQFSSKSADFLYIRLQMKSHAADAPAETVQAVQHCPVQDYGRIYMSRVQFGMSRGN